MFAPVTQALIEDAQIERGQTILDVATGPGEPALRIAEFGGSAGSVFGIDPAPAMIEAARRAAERRRLNNVHFNIAFADRLPFSCGEFRRSREPIRCHVFPASG
jgi:ubiquinone/menaquinone biosynthesis C-methylase UbiE